VSSLTMFVDILLNLTQRRHMNWQEGFILALVIGHHHLNTFDWPAKPILRGVQLARQAVYLNT
jgi:hypothetical protein